MKKYAAYGLSISLIIVGLFILAFAIKAVKPQGQGALQVITNIKGTVALNGKNIGATPLCRCDQTDMLTEGDYTLTVTPDDKNLSPYTAKVRIVTGVLTAVERTFLPGSLASAYILSLEKTNTSDPQLVVTSVPIGAMLTIDGNASGVTPYSQNNISASEHELEVQKAGYGKKTIKIRTVAGYRLVANVFLGTGADETDQSTAPITPVASASATPTASPAASIKILSTPTGFLNVRSGPSATSSVVGKALPGETYPFVDEQAGWFEITYKTQNGWVSSQYSQKVSGK